MQNIKQELENTGQFLRDIKSKLSLQPLKYFKCFKTEVGNENRKRENVFFSRKNENAKLKKYAKTENDENAI